MREMPAGDQSQGERPGGGAVTLLERLAASMLRAICRHAWQTVEILPGVQVVPAPERAIVRQRCGDCLEWRLRFDDGARVPITVRHAIELAERYRLVRFRPYDAGRGFADADAEPTLVLDPVESRRD